MLYARKMYGVTKQSNPNYESACKSIEERPNIFNLRLENGHYEIDTILLTKLKKRYVLVLTDLRSWHQIIRVTQVDLGSLKIIDMRMAILSHCIFFFFVSLVNYLQHIHCKNITFLIYHCYQI